MNADFIPTKLAERSQWCSNYKMQLEKNFEQLGITKEEMQHEKDICDLMIADIALIDQKKKELASAVSAANAYNTTGFGELRSLIAHHKTNPAMTEELQKLMGIAPVHVTFDTAAYKAVITADIFAGFVRIKFKKNGVNRVNLYHRKKGSSEWLFLATATKSPFDDHIQPATPGQPEHWEYRAYGVVDDLEIGQPSDIVDMVVSG